MVRTTSISAFPLCGFCMGILWQAFEGFMCGFGGFDFLALCAKLAPYRQLRGAAWHNRIRPE